VGTCDPGIQGRYSSLEDPTGNSETADGAVVTKSQASNLLEVSTDRSKN